MNYEIIRLVGCIYGFIVGTILSLAEFYILGLSILFLTLVLSFIKLNKDKEE